MNIVDKCCSTIIQDHREYPTELCKVKLTVIHDDWKQLKALNLEMWEICENPETIESRQSGYLVLEGKIAEVIAILTTKANEAVTITENESMTATAVQLPKITIPKFNGDYLKWQQFCDLFTEMIDKQKIPKSQKMWYLTSSLSGEAAALISHLPITTNNYDIAWCIIRDRYDNKRIIISSLIKSVIDQNGIGHKQYATAAEIQSIYDRTREGLLALTNLGINTESWGPLLIHLLLPKLDKQTRLLYEQTLQDPRQMPEVDNLLKFLELRFQSLEVINAKERVQPPKSLASTISNANNIILA